MRNATKLFGCGVATTIVAMFAVLPAAGASAAAKTLVLKSGGTAVANGSPGSTEIEVEECAVFSNGTVTANKAAKDILKQTSSSGQECFGAGVSISGLITETQLLKTGKVTLKGAVTVAISGGCKYEFKNPKGTFVVPGFVLFEGKAKGKRTKTSPKTCATTVLAPFSGLVTDEPGDEPFTAEVA
jgi:hypothetical protein